MFRHFLLLDMWQIKGEPSNSFVVRYNTYIHTIWCSDSVDRLIVISRLYAPCVCFTSGMSPRKPFECDSEAAADIMLLIDGSWSIGRTNFRRVRDFLEGLMTPFHIGPNHIQIGEDIFKCQYVLLLV